MVNVNPTNTRPPNDTPEIRKYKKRFNSEILCAALWGENRQTFGVGTYCEMSHILGAPSQPVYYTCVFMAQQGTG